MSNKLKFSVQTAVYAAIFIAALLLVNLIANSISDAFGLQFDLTADQRYELSGETQEYLNREPSRIEITVLMPESEMQGDSLSLVYYEQLKRYVAYSDGRVSVRYVDPDLDPSFVEDCRAVYPYTDKGCIVVTNPESGKFKVIYKGDLFVMPELDDDSATVQATDITVISEAAIDSAMIYVLSEKSARAALLTGHAGATTDNSELHQLEQDVRSLLLRANYDVVDVDLRTDELEGDIDLVVMPAPATDYAPTELAKLTDHFARTNSNHNGLLFTMADGTKLPNLNGWLNDWGVDVAYRQVLDTQFDQSYVFVPTIVEDKIFGNMTNQNSDRVILSVVPPLELLWNSGEKENRAVIALMNSSATSQSRDLDNAFDQTSDVAGPFVVGALMRQYNSANGQSSQADLALLPATLAAVSGNTTGANERMMTHIISYLSPPGVGLSVPAKTLSDPPLVTDNKELIWVLLLSLPALLLLVGAVVTLRRRHR